MVFSGVHVARSLVLCVMFYRSLLVLLSFFVWPWCCLSFDLRILITPLVSFDHCVICPMIYGFWLPLWCLLTILLSVLRFTDFDYIFGIFKLFLIDTAFPFDVQCTCSSNFIFSLKVRLAQLDSWFYLDLKIKCACK